MATIFEVTAALSGLALFCLFFLGFRTMRADLRALQRSMREGMGVLAASVGESTAAQRRELVAVARALPAEPAQAPSSATLPAARPAARRLAQRLAEGHDAARARLKLPELAPAPEVLSGEASEDEHKTIEVLVPPGMTARPPTPPADLEDEPEELTTVAPAPKAAPEVKKALPPVLKNSGYRYIGPETTRKKVERRSDPPVEIMTKPPPEPLDRVEHDAAARTEQLARAGVRIGENEKTPPSGTLVHGARVPAEEAERRRAGAFQPYKPEASYPAVSVPAPHRGAGPGRS